MSVFSPENYQVIKSLATKDLKIKYKNSVLGYFWSLLHPVIYISIFYVVFSRAFPTVDNYSLYVISGILFWTFFATATGQMINSIVANASILKSIYIPANYFVISLLVSSLVNLVLSLVPFVFVMWYLGAEIGFHLLSVIPVIVLLCMFTYGLALALCSFNVFYRDVSILWLSISPAMFYATPVAYTIDIIPERWLWLYKLNPLVTFFEGIHKVLYYGEWIGLYELGLMTAIALFSMFVGHRVYNMLEKGFVSNL